MLIVAMTLASVVLKTLNNKAFFLLFVLSITQTIDLRVVQAQPPHQLEFWLDDGGGACNQNIALYDGLRLTMQFPDPVRVAVPSHDQVVDLFISGTLIVLSPHRDRIHQQQKISMTAQLKSGHAFICTFDILPKRLLRDHSTPVELIRVRSKTQLRQAQSTAFHLLSDYLSSQSHPSTPPSTALSTLIDQWTDRINEYSRLDLLSADDFKVSSSTPVRAQKHLIYVTIDRIIRSRKMLYIRILLHNRSQAVFQLKKVHYFPKGQAISKVLWPPEDSHQLTTPAVVEAKRQPQVISLSAPTTLLTESPLYFTGIDGRSIPVMMDSFEELIP